MTFVLGWWGFISMFVNWVTLWTNGKALSQAAEMAPPEPTAWSAGKAPLDPGQPLTRRWQILVPIAVAAFWLFFLVQVVTG